jgi:PAS domain S-box-containing protein
MDLGWPSSTRLRRYSAGVVMFLSIGALVSGLNEKLQRAKRRAEAHAVALQREIDERQRAQATGTNVVAVMEALRTSEERYRLLFERNLAGIFRSHRDGRMLECNEAFVRLLGYASREEVLARNAKEFHLNPDDREVLLATLRPGVVISHQELQWRRADDTPMAVLWHVRETDEGYLEGIAIDISDRKRLEKAEREASELRAVANLANAAAHEINNPLTVIVGNLELTAREAGDRPPRIDQTLKAAKRVQEIVARMRRITRIEMADGRVPPMLDIRRSSD